MVISLFCYVQLAWRAEPGIHFHLVQSGVYEKDDKFHAKNYLRRWTTSLYFCDWLFSQVRVIRQYQRGKRIFLWNTLRRIYRYVEIDKSARWVFNGNRFKWDFTGGDVEKSVNTGDEIRFEINSRVTRKLTNLRYHFVIRQYRL